MRGLLGGAMRRPVEAVLAETLPTRRWFGGKARHIEAVRLLDALEVPAGAVRASLVLARVHYVSERPDTYLLDLAWAGGAEAEALRRASPRAVLAPLRLGGREGVVYEASHARGFRSALLAAIAKGARFPGARGEVLATPAKDFQRLAGCAEADIPSELLGGEQSNTSLRYADRLVLKLIRRVERGANPDLEICRFLAERTGFRNVPPLAGSLEYRWAGGTRATLGLLQGFVASDGDAWGFTLRAARRFLQGVRTRTAPLAPGLFEAAAAASVPEDLKDLAGEEMAAAAKLGRRTAELHLALAGSDGDPAFAPEPFTPRFRRELLRSTFDLADQVFRRLERRLTRLPSRSRDDARRVLALEPAVVERFRSVFGSPIAALRTRHHGDYHLGQVLCRAGDFVILDFEGEPARPLSERCRKRSPLRDVAGMIRSFDYAAHAGLGGLAEEGDPEPSAVLEGWAALWSTWVAGTFLRSYLDRASGAAFLPVDRTRLERLLGAYLLEKAVYELGYELDNRPDWVGLPLRGVLRLAAGSTRGKEGVPDASKAARISR